MKNLTIGTKLENLTCLSENVKLYVPSTMDINVNFNNSYYVEVIQIKLSTLFGGCTSHKAYGSWFSDELKQLVQEEVTVVQAFTSGLNNEQIDMVIEFAEWLKLEMNQEAVSMEINGKLYFV